MELRGDLTDGRRNGKGIRIQVRIVFQGLLIFFDCLFGIIASEGYAVPELNLFRVKIACIFLQFVEIFCIDPAAGGRIVIKSLRDIFDGICQPCFCLFFIGYEGGEVDWHIHAVQFCLKDFRKGKDVQIAFFERQQFFHHPAYLFPVFLWDVHQRGEDVLFDIILIGPAG